MDTTEKTKQSGIEAFGRQEYDTAIQTFLELIRANKADAELYSVMGQAYRAKGRPNEAVEALNKSLALKPDHFETVLTLGLVLARWGKPDDAIHPLCTAFPLP